ncbi:LPXTG cell wall anchor domain-containing protein [Candidatus Lokiarchaeum ossiferum]
MEVIITHTSGYELRVVIIVSINDFPPINTKVSDIITSTVLKDTTELSDGEDICLKISEFSSLLIFGFSLIGALSLLWRRKKEGLDR